MTDKELLELAAKAAGIEYNENYGKGFWIGEFYSGREWNPLTDDGDALRLEVALNLTTKHRFLDFLAEENTLCGGDYCKARRRAIVRAAAAIGEEK